MRRSLMLLALLVSVSLGGQALAQDRVYRWTDAEGHVHYSDKPRAPDAPEAKPAPAEAKDQALLDQAQQAFAAGNVEAVAALFRYFEEIVGARDAATDRKLVGYFLGSVKEGFGRPVAFETAQASSLKYVSTRIESAAADQWNASECLFKTYGLKTVFVEGETRRPAELAVTVCTGPRVETAALRQIEFRFTNPDAGTAQKLQTVLAQLMGEARRLTAPHR